MSKHENLYDIIFEKKLKKNITLEDLNLLPIEYKEKNITLENPNSQHKLLYEKITPTGYEEKNTIKYTSNDKDSTINEENEFKKLYEKYSKIIFNLTRNDIIEDGMYSESEKFVLKLMNEDEYLAINVLSFTISRYFYDDKLLISILNIISGFSSNILEKTPCFKSLVVGCLSNKNVFVKEVALKFFENSGTIDDIEILKNIDIKQSWLNEYRKEIISYLEG